MLDNQKALGIVPPDTELSPVNPYLGVTGPDGQPWPVQDTVRPWDSLTDEEKRLFARMARSVRRVPVLHRRPDRPRPGLPGGIRTARQHRHRGDLRQRRQWRVARTDRSTRSSSSTAISTPSRTACGSTTNSAPHPPTTTIRSVWAMAFNTPTSCSTLTPPTRAASPTPPSSPGQPGSPPTVRSAITTSTSPMSRRRFTNCWASSRRRRSAESRSARSRAPVSLRR